MYWLRGSRDGTLESMRSYGQFCSIARASEIIAERWTPIILRNLLMGCRTFNEIAEGAPGLSRTLLTKRLRELERAGIVEARPKREGNGSTYDLTQAGTELWRVLQAMGGWAQKWMEVTDQHSDPDAVLWSWSNVYLRQDLLPEGRVVVRFEFPDHQPAHRRRLWLVFADGAAELCHRDPGFDEDLVVAVGEPLSLARWHAGLISWSDALRAGDIRVDGRRDLARALPSWNDGPEVHRIAREDFDRLLPARNPRLDIQPNVPPTKPAGNSGSRPTRAIPKFGGTVIEPGSPEYDSARAVWNGAIDRRPSIIARCTTAEDVRAAIAFARERSLPLAVRGGGHSVAGLAVCDGGLVVDLTPMRAIAVDPGERRATAEGGALWGHVDAATQAFGLATTGGVVSHTGIGGLTLGGGIGWLMRPYGLTVDNLVGARVVTADGSLIVADENNHPELFWGLKGGGGNFGVVTSFHYRLHEVGPVILAGPVIWPLEEAAEVLAGYSELASRAPREVATTFSLRRAPALSALPPGLHGRPVCLIMMAHIGRPESGAEALAPFRSLGQPLLDLVEHRSYTGFQSLMDDTVPHGWHSYWKSVDIEALDEPVIDTLVEQAFDVPTPQSFTIVFHLGGAITDRDEADTAYTGRTAAHSVNVHGAWLPNAREEVGQGVRSWVRASHSAMTGHARGAYVNFLDGDDQDRVRLAYGEEKYGKLQAIKGRYDPDNVFRLNHNIQPAEPNPAE